MAGRGLPWPLSCVGVLGEGCCFELRQSSRGSRFNGAVRRRCLDSALRLDGSRFHVCSDVSAGSDARFKGCTRAEQKGQCAIASACAQTQNREWCATCGAYERRFRFTQAELQRRMMQWCWYLARSPLFELTTKRFIYRIQVTLNFVLRSPWSLAGPLLELWHSELTALVRYCLLGWHGTIAVSLVHQSDLATSESR